MSADETEVILAEERLTVSLPVRVTGGVRVGKSVVTETQTFSVDVRREELYAEELTADRLSTAVGAGAARQWDDLPTGEQEFELVLYEERVMVTTQVVAVERVRVRTRVVTDQVVVVDTVARERLDLTVADGTDPAEKFERPVTGHVDQVAVETTDTNKNEGAP